MKKTLLILTICTAFGLSSCGVIKNVISNLESIVDSEDTENSDSSDDSTNTGDTSAGGSQTEETVEEKQMNKIYEYAKTNGIHITGITAINSEFDVSATEKFVKITENGTTMIYDFSGDTGYFFMQYGSTYYRETLTNLETYGRAFSTAFTNVVNITSTFSDYVSLSTGTPGTYLGLAGKNYTYRKTTYGGYYEYKWFVSDKDGFTLKYEAEQYYDGEKIDNYSASITSLSYSASISAPASFEIL